MVAAPLEHAALNPDCSPSLQNQLVAGVEAFNDERFAGAVDVLQEVFSEQPACWTMEAGAASYWLGRAHAQLGQRDAAITVWQKGFEALRRAPSAGVLLADALVHHVFAWERTARYQDATRAYLYMLERSDLRAGGRSQSVLRERIRLLVPLLPPALMEQALQGGKNREEVLRWKPDGGSALANWWRSQDPVLSTPINEHLKEHLSRSVYARTKYREPDGRMGDRGRVYVRLGKPSHRTKIRLSDAEEAEFWVYQHVDREAKYLFVNRGGYGHYKIGNVRNLLYDGAVGGFSDTRRGRAKAQDYIKSMAGIYGDLAIYHDYYASRYGRLSSRAAQMSQRWGRRRARGAERRTVNLARTTQMGVRSDNRRADRLREERVPPAYYPSGTATGLSVAARLARFMEPNGRTRVEVYWSIPMAALTIPEIVLENERRSHTASMLNASLVLRDEHYKRTLVKKREHRIEAASARTNAMLSPQTSVVRADSSTGLFHIGIEWNQYALVARGAVPGAAETGRKIRTNTFRTDSLSSLRDEPGGMEMSDLKVLFAPIDEEEGSLETQLASASPYPFEQVAQEGSVALYFELYNMTLGPDGQARYSLEYELDRQGSQERLTATKLTYQSSKSDVDEYILLNLLLSEAAEEGASATGDLVVTVRATDEVSGREVERTVVFEAL
jgi:GWxTD domain-containing protein